MSRFPVFPALSSTVLSVAALLALNLTPRAQAATSSPPRPEARLAEPVDWLPLGTQAWPSLLRIPDSCTYLVCPLVVVSHPRNQSAVRLRDSPTFRVLIDSLLESHFAVLLSGDGGPTTWGSPGALRDVGQAHADAVKRFAWNGNTYALGLSMGGLMALRSALPDGPYRVGGVALIDAWTDLRVAWGTSLSRRAEISAAYGTASEPPPTLDPQLLAFKAPYLPLFVAASLNDGTVPALTNGERLYPHAALGVSEFVSLSGPHLGANRFTRDMAQKLVGFYKRLEGRTAVK
ncbi:alpha/beta hydrolase family protein [Deinococcus aerophilus]|uniref:Alpha/beta hydrolase n=1 Tax=Deinococcus aerophilus TaxID=522488 RepID=A0ABQ2GQ53_9DEIO|nr:alpha/beta hydrolase [Deinococcus aerophilus]GGM07467.1 alpha/beta hydrolase [Deinococcus aerophilus]